jgi:putative tryptophan/tyrosine transport system substrate-binding protein
MQRREFIAGLGSAAAWPVVARAQQGGPLRRVGVLMGGAPGEEQGQSRLAAFQKGLAELGWIDGHNIPIDNRWGAGGIDHLRTAATELVGLRPDVLLASTTSVLTALRQASGTTPIVFVMASDPVSGGFVASLARPGGNITGFILYEPLMASKWVELLKGIAPGLKRAAFLFNPEVAVFAVESLHHAEAAAARLKVELIAAAVHDDRDIESALAALARAPDGGVVVNADAFTTGHRQQIVALAIRHRLPVIYPFRYNATDKGLISYGSDRVDSYRQAASYVDRILRGEKPADLPVQAPTKFEMVINLNAAREIGLTIPETLLATADEVIQ